MRAWLALASLVAVVSTAQAGDVEIVGAKLRGGGTNWSASVTLRHGDTGWEHYADAWRIVAPDGTVLGTRILYHPHVDEQPFTRGLSGIEIPADTTRVFVEARDSVHGWAETRFELAVPR